MALTEEDKAYISKTEALANLQEAQKLNAQKDLSQMSMYGGQGMQENLIQWQLDLSEELDRIEHLLKGHILKRDEKGNEYWAEPTDLRLKPFNDYGVQLLMNVISFYLNRNTILSNYREEMINWKMLDLSDEISDMIYMKYEEMGMDTKDKMKLYPIIVREIVDTVHSAYLRALGGLERDSLRKIMSVSQNANMGVPMQYPGQSKQKGGFFDFLKT